MSMYTFSKLEHGDGFIIERNQGEESTIVARTPHVETAHFIATACNRYGDGCIPATLESKPDRTQIAAMAMQGMLGANPECLFGNMTIPISGLLAAYAVEYADALIAELEKTKP